MVEKKDVLRKAGVLFVIGIALIMVFATLKIPVERIENTIDDAINDEPKIEWVHVQTVNSWELGEFNPGSEGWLSAFHLDYGQVPETVLANNATDWGASGDARGYVDTDNAETDLKSEDPSYFVFRCKFDDDAKDAGSWNYSRFRVNLTISGDETISDVGEYDNSTTDGDAVVSAAGTNRIFINFWWDDGVDGYRITDDGSLVWSISIYERK